MKTKKKYPELQMPKETFYGVLRRLLELHEIHLEMLRDKRQKIHTSNVIKLYKTKEDWTLNYFDDFYEFLEHWEDYKRKK